MNWKIQKNVDGINGYFWSSDYLHINISESYLKCEDKTIYNGYLMSYLGKSLVYKIRCYAIFASFDSDTLEKAKQKAYKLTSEYIKSGEYEFSKELQYDLNKLI